jgi:deoxyribonuclease (pyrimidine dimer)
MRVNLINPMFLTDQHLVAEYREVKMGPKALSRSLGSIKGIDTKRISPVYTLNTGHTYFFYDKNKFLEERLALIVDEMRKRGFQTNIPDLIDDSYDYHFDVWNEKWWGTYVATPEAIAINKERIDFRMDQKIGWYKYFGFPVLDMETIETIRTSGEFFICPNCKSIWDGDSTFCWNCCKKVVFNKWVLIFREL